MTLVCEKCGFDIPYSDNARRRVCDECRTLGPVHADGSEFDFLVWAESDFGDWEDEED